MEATHSRRLLYLLDSKRYLVTKFTIVDVNTEIKNALLGSKSGESTLQIRESLLKNYNLLRNGPNSDIILPQVFFMKSKTRSYLGDYLTLQYLEDCGLLSKILTGEICVHYRIY